MRASANGALIGIPAGFGAVSVYTLIIVGNQIGFPEWSAIVLAASFGPFLLIASYGLRETIRLNGSNVAAELAFFFNSGAAVLVTAMFMVQLGVRDAFPPVAERNEEMRQIVRMLDHVQLSLDVAWDVFITTGTMLFGLSMLAHPRLGWLLGLLGIAAGSSVLVLNIYTFPQPPYVAGLADFGPVIGAWYALVALAMMFNIGWIVRQNQG
jgi:hypothetical protein